VTANEDFLFAQEALAQGFVTDAQVKEALLLQRRMAEELRIDERVGVILVKRGWLAEDQARRVEARISPQRGEPGQIHGYRLLEIVGRGAMGTVYRAIHTGLNRTVAIKILRQDLAGDRTQVERLKAEAAMLAALDHPNIVRALDAGESNGFPYVVMEFVEGETLRDRMRREGPLPEPVALEITRGLADALERARRMGVVHRDVKPGNVLLTRAGVPKLMDLGLAKGPVDLGLTQHGSTVGTPQYIAPEQAVDPRSADTRSDIYALGATLYAMLTGRPPFDGATLAEILTKVLYESPLPVRTLRPEVSAETGYLVERMMLRDPSLRYRTPALVVADIDRLTGGHSILPEGFSGNWEAWLLKRRWRRISILVPATIAAAVAVAFGVKWYVTRSAGAVARSQVDVAAQRLPSAPPESDTRLDVERRLAEARVLLAAAREHDSSALRDLESLERVYGAELERFDAIAAAEGRAAPLEAGGRFREAEAELAAARRAVRNQGPAHRALEVRLAGVRARSDEALVAARAATFPAAPRDVEDLATTLEAWTRTLDERFVATPVRADEARSGAEAVDAVRVLARALSEGRHALADEVVAGRVASHRLADLRADVAAVRARLDRVRSTTAEDQLRKPRYVGVEALDAIVRDPIDARVRALEAAVAEAWSKAQSEARAAVSGGDPASALAIYQRFARSAAEEGAFVELAAAARAARDDLESRTRSAFERAETAVSDLAAAVASALARGDVAAVREQLARARERAEVFAPRPGALESFDPIPAAWDRLYARAIEGVAAHVGRSKDAWIDRLAFNAALDAERLLEIRSIDRDQRTFAYVSHSGGFAHEVQTRAIADIAVDDLERLAGLSFDSADDALTLAVHAFPRLEARPDDPDDPGPRLEAYATVVDRLGRAGVLDSPLATKVRASLAELKARADRDEALASDTFDTAERAFAKGQYPEAYGGYLDLLRPPLVHTKVARDGGDRIRARVARIRGELKLGVVQLALNGARVVRNLPSSPDGLDVAVTMTFDTPQQLKNFSAGLGRLVNPRTARVVTPDPSVVDRSLLLLPDSLGEVVRDRPLVLPTFLDPAVESSVSFLFWSGTQFFLGIDLDGVQVGVVSARPDENPFPPDVPRLDPKEDPPKFNHYGLGRGVRFHLGPDFQDPTRWPWGEEVQGRRFVPPELARRKKELLSTRWFAFDNNADRPPYRVRLTRIPGRGARFEVNDVTVLEDFGEAYKALRPSGKIQVLTYTPCVIDDLQITGRVSAGWLERMTKLLEPGTSPSTPPGADSGSTKPGK